MAPAHTSVRSTMENIGRFWPLFILAIIVLLFFARPEVSMPDVVLARQVMHYPDGANALPYPVAMALVHYATLNITPQQTKEEMMVTTNILTRRGPCNFLVYGLGFDSPLWQALNHGGRTVFLEEDPSWISQVSKAHPYLESYAVNYTTSVSEADGLLAYAKTHKEICSPVNNNVQKSKCKLALKTLPEQIYKMKWDVIMIDAPRGYFPEAPGRMTAIYSASLMARAQACGHSTDILLHDVDRPVENTFSTEFLCARNLIESAGKLWHFQLFGEGHSPRKDFCSD